MAKENDTNDILQTFW